MKYSKFVKENLGNIKSYLFSFLFSILLSTTICIFASKGTYAGFGGVTGSIGIARNVVYSSNWPTTNMGTDQTIIYSSSFVSYVILDNQFPVPEGYEFISWNTKTDGSGTSYIKGDTIKVESKVYLYAQWNLVVDEDDGSDDILDKDEVVEEDKVPEDDNVSEDEENGELDSEDGNDDNLDIPGDEIDDGNSSDNNESSENDDSSSDNNGSGSSSEDESGSGSSTGTGTGSGSSNSGGVTSGGGNTSDNSHSSGSSNGGSVSNNSESSSSQDEVTSDENNDILEEENKTIMYQFKFMVGKEEFANTSCNVLDGEICNLLLPENKPIKEGYTFIGWSLSNLCSKQDIINSSVSVNSSNTYYACFEINVNTEDTGNWWIYLIVSVWVIALIAIYFSIRVFKRKLSLEEND